jgi:hypothetical protein
LLLLYIHMFSCLFNCFMPLCGTWCRFGRLIYQKMRETFLCSSYLQD